MLHELRVRYPDVVVCLIGKLRRNERTSTSMTPDEVAELASVSPRVVDAFDRPLAEQLALAEACDLFLSPHTGFGMAVLAVGTPWLTLAGGPWPEFFFNGVPFCSVLPDPERYPCYEGLEAPVVWSDDEGEGPRVPSMSGRRIIDDLPRLLGAAERLLQQSLPYETALREHFDRLLAFHGGDRTRIWSIDGIHEQYV